MIRGWARAVGEWFGVVRFSGDEPSVDHVVTTFMNGLARVDRQKALAVPAVKRGRDMICSVSTLPLVQRDAANVVTPSPFLSQIDRDVANVVTLAQTAEDLLFDGIAWWVITERDALGFPVHARHVLTTSVSLQPPPGYNPAPLPSGEDPRGAAVWVDGVRTPARNVIRFDSPNPALLGVGAPVVRRAVAIDAAARMYSDNPVPLDYFTPNADADPATDKVIQQILTDWRNARRTRTTAYVPAALDYNTVDIMSPRDLQLVELQRQAALDVANLVGLDPEDVGVSTTSRTYQNATDRRQDKINDTYAPYMSAITERLSMGDVTRPGYTVDFKIAGYLRADPKTRAEYYAAGIRDGWLDAEDVQLEEGRPVKVIKKPEPAGALPDNVRELRPRPRLAAAAGDDDDPWVVRFDGDDVQRVAFVGVDAPAVDWENRTISGIAMPYGRTSLVVKSGRRWQFRAGSLKHGGELRRVKMLRDHDFSQSGGYVAEAQERPDGMWVKFQVGRGPEGDRFLAEAEDGTRDALSCGVIIRACVKHPTERGTWIVTDAHWQETSLLAVPAFDDARVMADGTSEGEIMHTCPTCGAELTPGVGHTCPSAPAPVPAVPVPAAVPAPIPAPTPEQFGAWAAAYDAWRAENGPQFVNPVRPVAVTEVTDPAPYRFDAKGDTLLAGTHEFSSDVFAAARGDHAARMRVDDWITAHFDVVSTDVNELNPTRNRPDMFVDQRDFRYPVWQSINKGTLSDVTPFTFPKFSSASGLVGNHTEGVEPSSGTYVTTNDTVTPTPVSGKIKISRVTIDQGGNPQITNLIWRQMQKAWYEALEARAVAALDAVTPTAIPLTAGGGTTGQTLDSEITAALASLQFIRGGFSMDTMFLQIDLYKAFVAAKDSGGRRLYPAIGAQNATGTVRERFAAIDINGITGLPAWALAATGSVSASSYLFDRDSVWGWASNPRRMDFDNTEVANVYMGLWGYAATSVVDLTGVREITYDPVP